MRLPYADIEFTTKGEADGAQLDAAMSVLRTAQPTDVLVLAHGWNNDMRQARELFERIVDGVADELDARPRPDRRIAAVGILWPSVRWADDDQLAGGGASAGAPALALAQAIDESVDDPALNTQLKALIPTLESSADVRAQFLTATRALLPATGVADEDAPPATLREGDPDEIFSAVEEAQLLEGEAAPAEPGGGAPAAPGTFPDLLTAPPTTEAASFLRGLNPLVTARAILNTVTYYTMKSRAGTVGTAGVAPLLDRIAVELPGARIHLVGHSFGARVAAAAAASAATPVGAIALLQGAFSHFGFAADYDGKGSDGAFRPALTAGRLRGPVIATCTHNDSAVTKAYAIASRLARQTGAGLGGADDPYGGIGANGARRTPEADDSLTLQDVDADYPFRPGAVYNLRADAHVAGHSDVTGRQVIHALVSAVSCAA